MSEKLLSVKEWEKFAKGKGLKDAALLKVLGALERAESNTADGAEAQLAALDELDELLPALVKANKGDKDLATHADEMRDAARKLRKEAERRAAEEQESPAILTQKLVPLLRQVRQGDTMQALIALDGHQAAVLLSRRPISPSQRELLKQRLGGGGGIKYLPAQCLFEQEAHTFVVPSAAAGLAKKLKAALLAQAEQRLKVRVRGADPHDVDEDLDDAEAPSGTGDASTTTPSADDGARARFEAALAQLEPLLQAALQAQHPESSKLRAVAEFAREKAAAGQHTSGLAALTQLARLLAGGAAAQPESTAQTAAPPTAAPRIAPRVAFTQARLDWDQMRKRMQSELRKVETAVLDQCRGESDFGAITTSIRQLYTMLEVLDERLIDTLDAALSATDAARRTALHGQARGIVGEYVDFVRSDELLAAVDVNGFAEVALTPELMRCLKGIDAQLRAAMAA